MAVGQDVEAAHAAKFQVEHDHVRPLARHGRDARLAVAHVASDDHAGAALNELAQPVADDLVVVDQDDANGGKST